MNIPFHSNEISQKFCLTRASAQFKSLPENRPRTNEQSRELKVLAYAFLARFSALRTEIFVGATKISVFC